MKKKFALAVFCAACALFLLAPSLRAADPPNRFVSPDASGKLVYERDERGNRIPDFSGAGYRGGGVAIPDVSARVVVSPAPGDDGARIQAAIDFVSGLPLDTNGFRGAVLLGRGRFEIARNLGFVQAAWSCAARAMEGKARGCLRRGRAGAL